MRFIPDVVFFCLGTVANCIGGVGLLFVSLVVHGVNCSEIGLNSSSRDPAFAPRGVLQILRMRALAVRASLFAESSF